MSSLCGIAMNETSLAVWRQQRRYVRQQTETGRGKIKKSLSRDFKGHEPMRTQTFAVLDPFWLVFQASTISITSPRHRPSPCLRPPSPLPFRPRLSLSLSLCRLSREPSSGRVSGSVAVCEKYAAPAQELLEEELAGKRQLCQVCPA